MSRKIKMRATFGLTEQEMATLLNVSRSQWSLYKMSVRNLPSEAYRRFTEMEMYMISPKAEAFQKELETAYEDSNLKKELAKLLKENEFQLRSIARKIKAVQETLDKHKETISLTRFLGSPEEIKKAKEPEIVDNIEWRAIYRFKKTQSKLNLLQLDHELLKSKQECLQRVLKHL